nr:response regulator [Lysinibacillus timonensis]
MINTIDEIKGHLEKKNTKPYLLSEKDIKPFFDVLNANVKRSRLNITMIFIEAFSLAKEPNSNNYSSEVENQIINFLISNTRSTDMIFKMHTQMQWGIILIQNVENDAIAFLKRIFSKIKSENPSFYINSKYVLTGTVAEIKNGKLTFEELIQVKNYTLNSKSYPWEIIILPYYKKPLVQKIKVSIVDDNEVFRDMLKMNIQQMKFEFIEVEVQSFKDGLEFLQSDWYVSNHNHIVMINDILPRKNGLEVLHTLRQMPNQKKFIVYMMTIRKNQSDMLNAYESGVDEYLVKPFDIRLFKAQLKRTLTRLLE